MKNLFNKLHGIGFLSVILTIAAILCGADGAFAMSDVTVVDGTETPTADDKGLATQLNGKAATSTQATEAEFAQEEIEKLIANFRPFDFPLEHDIVHEAIQVSAKTYQPIHYRSGATELDFVSTAAVTSTGTTKDNQVVTFTVGTNINSINEFSVSSTVLAKGVQGYADDGVTESGDLMLYVTAKTASSITLIAVNAKGGSNTVTIPSGTILEISGVAASESQMIVDPENYQPTPVTTYLQKKLANLVMTDDWIEQAKKVPFVEKDLRNNALYNFKRKNARSHWYGVKKRIKVNNVESRVGSEFVYMEEGLLRQINMMYSYDGGSISTADLNAIAKMQFTKFAASNVATAYCGKNFIERLMNIDLTVQKEIKFEDITEAGMTIRAWKNNFGTIRFVHEPTLDDIGYEDFAAVVDIKNACHYVKRSERQDVVDMKKGVGENREARREITSVIDCIALKGYNSVLVGPADKIGQAYGLGNISSYATKAAALPTTNLSDGMLVYLTDADATNGFAAGTIAEYSSATKTWHEFNGTINA